MWEIGGITLHGYGLLVGLGLVVGVWLVQLQAKRQQIEPSQLEPAIWWAIVFGVIGARFYHVATDFHLYQDDLVAALYIWQGGLSIIGAVLGGMVGIWLGRMVGSIRLPLLTLLDLSVFGLPVGQAIGRLGNAVNQELYGPSTDLPWGMMLNGDASQRFHPLFLYEAVINLGIAGLVWWVATKGSWQLGRGAFFATYVLLYSMARFGLDFLRIDKAMLAGTGIGVNQLVMLITAILAAAWLARTYEKK